MPIQKKQSEDCSDRDYTKIYCYYIRTFVCAITSPFSLSTTTYTPSGKELVSIRMVDEWKVCSFMRPKIQYQWQL